MSVEEIHPRYEFYGDLLQPSPGRQKFVTISERQGGLLEILAGHLFLAGCTSYSVLDKLLKIHFKGIT